jgi:hypothetical protein
MSLDGSTMSHHLLLLLMAPLVCSLHPDDAAGPLGTGKGSALRRPVVVLHLPHTLGSITMWRWQYVRLLTARQQLERLNMTTVCFWWTDGPKYMTTNVTDLPGGSLSAALGCACDGRLSIFHSMVAPHYKSIISAIRQAHGPKWARWQWWFADVPFILSAHRHWDDWFAHVSHVWYVEYDVAWTGDLGDILRQLGPTSERHG